MSSTCRNRRDSCVCCVWRSPCTRHSWRLHSACLSLGPRRWHTDSWRRCLRYSYLSSLGQNYLLKEEKEKRRVASFCLKSPSQISMGLRGPVPGLQGGPGHRSPVSRSSLLPASTPMSPFMHRTITLWGTLGLVRQLRSFPKAAHPVSWHLISTVWLKSPCWTLVLMSPMATGPKCPGT